jgi:hypothetical protein
MSLGLTMKLLLLANGARFENLALAGLYLLASRTAAYPERSGAACRVKHENCWNYGFFMCNVGRDKSIQYSFLILMLGLISSY